MFIFIDGQETVLDFEQVEQLVHQAYIDRWGTISMAQWRGSYEYQALYPFIQLMVENGNLTLQAINEALESLAQIGEEIKRPAVLHSRVSERFLEDGYIAVPREPTLATAGIMAVCVDQPDRDAEDDAAVALLLANECMPAGVHIEGVNEYTVVLSNGQSIVMRWTNPTEVPTTFKLTLLRARNSQYPVDDVDTIIDRFMTNFNEQNALGLDITPETYYTIHRDAPWASQVLTEYSFDDGTTWLSIVHAATYTDKFIGELLPENVIIQ